MKWILNKGLSRFTYKPKLIQELKRNNTSSFARLIWVGGGDIIFEPGSFSYWKLWYYTKLKDLGFVVVECILKDWHFRVGFGLVTSIVNIFIQTEDKNSNTANIMIYWDMITDFMWLLWNQLFSQQNSETFHIRRETSDCLDQVC